MDKRSAEALFVQIINNIKPSHYEECNMIIDVFLEEEFTMGELKRMILYLLDKVKDDRKEKVKETIENKIGLLEKQ